MKLNILENFVVKAVPADNTNGQPFFMVNGFQFLKSDNRKIKTPSYPPFMYRLVGLANKLNLSSSIAGTLYMKKRQISKNKSTSLNLKSWHCFKSATRLSSILLNKTGHGENEFRLTFSKVNCLFTGLQESICR